MNNLNKFNQCNRLKQLIINSSKPQKASQLFSSNYQEDYTEQFAGPSDWTQEGTTAEIDEVQEDTHDETKDEDSTNRSTSSHHSKQYQPTATPPPQRQQLNIATEAEDFFASFSQPPFPNPSQSQPRMSHSVLPQTQPSSTPQ